MDVEYVMKELSGCLVDETTDAVTSHVIHSIQMHSSLS